MDSSGGEDLRQPLEHTKSINHISGNEIGFDANLHRE